jgi:hypothetical protein
MKVSSFLMQSKSTVRTRGHARFNSLTVLCNHHPPQRSRQVAGKKREMESALGYHEQNAMAADMSFRPFCTNDLGYSQKNNPYKREFMRVMGQPAVWSCHYLLKDIFLMNAQAIGF